MLLALFLSMMLQAPTKPDGWQHRTDARPYLSVGVDGKPVRAVAVPDGEHLEAGWEVHVRTIPKGGSDDWRAKVILTRSLISFALHRNVWVSDDWVYYQMLGRVSVRKGHHRYAIGFLTSHAGIGCFGDFRVGGASVVQVDTKTFFAKRKDGFRGRDELIFDGFVDLEDGDYDAVVTLGCHPGKMGEPLASSDVDAWRSTRFMLLQGAGKSFAPLKVAHLAR